LSNLNKGVIIEVLIGSEQIYDWNCIMRGRIFSHLKNLTAEPDISSKIEDILNELQQLRSTAPQVRAESILLEELRQLNNSASQVRNEISNILYFYLIRNHHYNCRSDWTLIFVFSI
jgi:hypothetical protein